VIHLLRGTKGKPKNPNDVLAKHKAQIQRRSEREPEFKES
jgi:hypothetical protein